MARILIIDDEADFRKLVRNFLEADGHVVHEAVNGLDGMERFRSVRPDLVVTDIIMPHQNGIETIREIRNIDPDVKIIAVSGGGQHSASAFLLGAEESGADRSLAKPFRRSQFLAEVDQLVVESADNASRKSEPPNDE